MKIKIPEPSVVLLLGASGAGKSTFAAKHFAPTEVLSSDYFRGLVSDDENSLPASGDAFDVLYTVLRKRNERMRLSVIDATNVKREDRRALIDVGKQHDMLRVAIVLDVSEDTCHERNASRPNRQFGNHVVRNHRRKLRKSLKNLKKEGFAYVYVLDEASIDDVVIERTPLLNNYRHESGPFDIVGDIHGCFDETVELLTKLGYTINRTDETDAPTYGFDVVPPEGRRALFLGDLVDRGPNSPDVLRLVMSMVNAGTGFCVIGNHDFKLLRHLRGRKVKVSHGLAETIEQLSSETDAFKAEVDAFIQGLISHMMLDDGRLCIAHAGIKEDYQGRASGRVRSFCMYGDTSGETDEFGLPIRKNWAMDYRGDATVVYGHTPTISPQWLNNTICIDTGCVFGGKLTALRYPEMELVDVPAAREYYEPTRPLMTQADIRRAQHISDDVLELETVTGHMQVRTSLIPRVTIHPQNGAAALETMSRFCVDPKWLVYLPPTMSPPETSQRDSFLEHPDEAFDYFRAMEQTHVVCEEKHMGSRAIVVVCKHDDVAIERFGFNTPKPGRIFTRTGRPFFDDEKEHEILSRVRAAMTTSELWTILNADYVVLDCEIMPWSAKAGGLIQNQYGAVGVAANAAFAGLSTLIAQTNASGAEFDAFSAWAKSGADDAARFEAAYQRYCWPAPTVDQLRVAPFHVLAAGRSSFFDREHRWHLETIAKLVEADATPTLQNTEHITVDLYDETSVAEATAWWGERTDAGAEGMVVKPSTFIARTDNGIVQPGVKVRGREYLRIIYGPSYTASQNLDRLRNRSTRRKRSLAIRETALGVEALDRFVRGVPLREVHECVFGVLALESEPVDPRL